MVPGLNATPRAFVAQMETLWRHGPVTIADNRNGSTMREIAEAILADAPPRFALGGFSMGGYIAFEIMRRAPERVTALALIDTSARPDTPEATEKRRGIMRLASAGKFMAAAASTFPSAVHPDHVGDEHLKAIHLDMARENGLDAYLRQQEAIITRPDSRPDLGAIAVPTVVIVGDGDQITPIEHAREMAEAIPGARLEVIAGAGHLALIEQPEQVNAALEAWLLSSGE